MKPWWKWIGLAAASIVVIAVAVAVLALGWVLADSYFQLTRTYPKRPVTIHVVASAGAAAHGRYLANVLGCTGCHGQDLTGMRMPDVPGSTVYAPNLTIALKNLSDADVDRVIRQSLMPDGSSVIVMPSHVYARLSDDESASIISYLRSLNPRGAETPPLRFGLMVRAGLALGKFRTEAEEMKDTREPIDVGPRFARGRHLTQVVCAQCHGADLGGTPDSPVLVTPDLLVVMAYGRADFHHFFKTGKALGNREAGIMSEVARVNFSHFSSDDVDAIYDYLKERATRITRTSQN